MIINRPTPFFIVARLIFSRSSRLLNIPQALLPFVQSLFTIISGIVTNLGVIQTILILVGFRRALLGSVALDSLIRNGTEIEKQLVELIRPNWLTLNKSRSSSLKIINSLLFSTIFLFY